MLAALLLNLRQPTPPPPRPGGGAVIPRRRPQFIEGPLPVRVRAVLVMGWPQLGACALIAPPVTGAAALEIGAPEIISGHAHVVDELALFLAAEM